MIESSQTVAHIAETFPASTRVFARHKINFCCGGELQLSEVCNKKGLDIAAVVAEISRTVELAAPLDAEAWESRSTQALIDHIIEAYHRPLQEELPRLKQLAEKVARVHGASNENLPLIARVFNALKVELEGHLQKEERILFPAMLEGYTEELGCPIAVMLKDHDSADSALETLRELTGNYQVPPDACRSWRALWAGLEQLEREIGEHIYLENEILFPRAAAPECKSAN